MRIFQSRVKPSTGNTKKRDDPMRPYDLATARAWAEIDVSKVLSNYHSALSELAPGVSHFAVLKANAYGFGAVPMAKILYGAGCRHFAFACVPEAVEVARALPYDADFLVMGDTAEAEIGVVFHHKLIPTIYSFEKALLFSAEAAMRDSELRFHCKVDTGLNRLGFSTGEAAMEISRIAKLPGLRIQGVFSHLQRRSGEFDRLQAGRLLSVSRMLQTFGINVPMLHMLDSIGMWRYPEYQMDAVRDGAYLYGNTPNDYKRPEKISLPITLKARVLRVHDIEAGECVGYDSDHPLQTKTCAATLAIGYADGYPREMSHVGQVEIHGKRAPVIGTVCMDLTMVDISEIPETRVNDTAILLGGGIGIHEYIGFSGGYANEYLSRLSRRVPRVFLKDGQVVEIVTYL